MQTVTQKSKITSSRLMILWLASFAVVASFLYFHFGVPLLPIALAGGVTLVITATRCFLSGRARSPGEGGCS
jgi:small neutral amino acid transporter SnatA (MarC family)